MYDGLGCDFPRPRLARNSTRGRQEYDHPSGRQTVSQCFKQKSSGRWERLGAQPVKPCQDKTKGAKVTEDGSRGRRQMTRASRGVDFRIALSILEFLLLLPLPRRCSCCPKIPQRRQCRWKTKDGRQTSGSEYCPEHGSELIKITESAAAGEDEHEIQQWRDSKQTNPSHHPPLTARLGGRTVIPVGSQSVRASGRQSYISISGVESANGCSIHHGDRSSARGSRLSTKAGSDSYLAARCRAACRCRSCF